MLLTTASTSEGQDVTGIYQFHSPISTQVPSAGPGSNVAPASTVGETNWMMNGRPKAIDGANSSDATAFREEPGRAEFSQHFLARLAAVADEGSLFDVDKTMSLMAVPYKAITLQDVPQPPDCSVEWHPGSLLVTSVSLEGQTWFRPTQYGAKPDQIPDYQRQQAGGTRFIYTVTHGIRCGDSPFIRDYTEGKMVLNIPAYACVTLGDLDATMPRISVVGALGFGPRTYRYFGHTDDDSGTTLNVNFDFRYPCALNVEIDQSQQYGFRYARAVYKRQKCIVESTRTFCASHERFGGGGKQVDELRRFNNQNCPSISTMYDQEPRTGGRPLPSPMTAGWRDQCS
nr:hypothetical protein HUO10_005399 [Paraburkholderia busanensis]